jgi:hypothetical protein
MLMFRHKMVRFRFKRLLSVILILCFAATVEASSQDGKDSVSPQILGCYSLPAILTENNVAGGKARVSVYCSPGDKYEVSMDLRMKARELRKNAEWTNATREGKKQCSLGRVYPLACTLEFSFPATSNGKTREFAITGTITVNGKEGIPIGNDVSWVFNQNGKPYPRVRYNRPPVPFPSKVGPWFNGDPRDQDRFIRECKAHYARNDWYIPPSGVKVEYHHIHPLGWGGRNVGENCYILTPDQHALFTSWWAGLKP